MVTLRSADPLDTPLINFRYFKEGTNDGQQDLDAVVAGIRFVRDVMAEAGDSIVREERPGSEVKDSAGLEAFVEENAWGHHASCTCKIGPDDDPMAVLDSNFCVRGIKGLRVVDASVFPKIPGFFIVTSVYMIGEKAADAILADRSEVG
jgi:choline dehydrogenase-like flavoprotein